jgi:hypothetical protein
MPNPAGSSGKRDPTSQGSSESGGVAQAGAVLARKVPTLKAMPTAASRS